MKHCHQQCDQDYCYTDIYTLLISAQNKYASILHMYVPLHQYCFLHVDPTLLYIWLKPKKLLTISKPFMCQQEICPSNATYANYFMCSWDNNVSTYTSYYLPAIKYVIRNTAVHTFLITGISCWANIPATLYICLTKHFYHSLHTDPTLLHISIKTQ